MSMTEIKGKIAFIGSGNMARAIIGGLVRAGFPGDRILVVNPGNPASMEAVRQEYGAVPSNPESLAGAEVIVIAVKPQSFPEAAANYRAFANPKALFISIMAGLSNAAVEDAFGGVRTVRVMPNIALAAGCGASGYAPGKYATEADAAVAQAIFSAAGLAVRVPEDRINDVTALSGSGAAYIYLLVEAMRDAAVEEGMDPAAAAALAGQTLIGAAKQLERENLAPEALRKRITSKNGTTEAAIEKMTESGFFEAVQAGYRANKARSRQLSDELCKKYERG
ncbi:MAG TPA: pyrroline-5-carboxylate reductase [Clostridiales bacterium]|nr:pyrroline-5-carboxylate reductase [Clostridiales bacterium]HBR08319.1 pyrroline-5-carboxylate reductase [Clostridiales bacterium]